MGEFDKRLSELLTSSLDNFYQDNYDDERFGPEKKSKWTSLKKLLRKYLISKAEHREVIDVLLKTISKNYLRLNEVYNLLQDKPSKNLWLDLIAFKILGYRRVKLPVNNAAYHEQLNSIKRLRNGSNKMDLEYPHFKCTLEEFDLSDLGYDIRIFLNNKGVHIDFVLEQYNYRNMIHAEEGDVVIDAGGCWGDTALYFREKVGAKGEVHTFEFVPENIKILNHNVSINEGFGENVLLHQNPLWDRSDVNVYFKDSGPSTTISFDKTEGLDEVVKTITIDDFCDREKIAKIDFIKMDIEGAEMNALKGAKKTIEKFKPKLAITNYHSIEDFVDIPLWINSLGLGYKIFFGHYTIHWEESVIFATTS